MKRLFFLFVSCIFLFSCNQEIVDFFEAIQDYGYRAAQPLGPKKLTANENLCGGYVYEELPVVISKKDEFTYEIKFLSVLLHKEDVVIEAHATLLGNYTFLNLDMGDYYCFMRTNLVPGQELQISLLKDALKQYIPQEKIKGWLESNPGETTYLYDPVNDYSLDIYFSFAFERVTLEEAYRIQKYRLRIERLNLFENCESYEEYEELVRRFPGDEFIPIGQKALFDRCATIDQYNEFIAYFPNSEWVDDAKSRINYIIESEQLAKYLAIDKQAFELAQKENTIDAWESFKLTANTNAYRDSANQKIGFLASGITKDNVEWKWTNGESEKAFQLLFYKVDYLKNQLDSDWIVELLGFYALKYNQPEMTQKVMHYFDVLVEKRIAGDNFLNLYLYKGFLLWSLDQADNALRTFELKLDDVYEDGSVPFKEQIKIKYAYFKEQGLVFPNEKETWKRIKKLKIEK